MPQQQPNPIFGRFDMDPARWKPLFYRVEISVGVNEGEWGVGTIQLNAQPYIITKLQHKIIGNTADPETSGLYQDGQYDIEIRDETHNYTNAPVNADLIMGNPGFGYFMDLPYPIPLPGTNTLTFRITNRVTRVLVPQADTFNVQIGTHGIADWGTIKPNHP